MANPMAFIAEHVGQRGIVMNLAMFFPRNGGENEIPWE
jgi:hypothetical protein